MSAIRKLDPLVHRDRLAELDARPRVLDRVLVRRLGDAHGSRRPSRAAWVVERAHRDLEALALLTERVARRAPFTSWKAIAEVSVARCPILSRCFSTVTPSSSVGTTNAERPLVALALVGRGEDHDPGGMARVRDEHLRAVDDVLVALADGRRLDPGDVRPAFGSVRPKEHRIGDSRSGGSHSAFCSSLPASMTGPAPSELATIETAIPAQPQDSSSHHQHPVEVREPGPAVLLGNVRVRRGRCRGPSR